jgi:hypothetical protein
LRALQAQALLVNPTTKTLQESVLPWLVEKMTTFLKDDNSVDANVEQVVYDGWYKGLKAHRDAIEGRKKRKEDMVFEAEQRVIKKELERQERRLARERRRKENELKALREEIKKSFIKKGDIKDNMIAWDILDINGNYEKGKIFAGSIGG